MFNEAVAIGGSAKERISRAGEKSGKPDRLCVFLCDVVVAHKGCICLCLGLVGLWVIGGVCACVSGERRPVK